MTPPKKIREWIKLPNNKMICTPGNSAYVYYLSERVRISLNRFNDMCQVYINYMNDDGSPFTLLTDRADQFLKYLFSEYDSLEAIQRQAIDDVRVVVQEKIADIEGDIVKLQRKRHQLQNTLFINDDDGDDDGNDDEANSLHEQGR